MGIWYGLAAKGDVTDILVQVTPEGVQKARKAWTAYKEARQRSPKYRNQLIPYEFIDDPVLARQVGLHHLHFTHAVLTYRCLV